MLRLIVRDSRGRSGGPIVDSKRQTTEHTEYTEEEPFSVYSVHSVVHQSNDFAVKTDSILLVALDGDIDIREPLAKLTPPVDGQANSSSPYPLPEERVSR
jgi:hypothetical protein